MHRYPELKNLENILMEVDASGSILSEDVSVLLNVQQSTAANILKTAQHRGYLSRKNVNKGQKFGGPKFSYDLTYKGISQVAYIRKNKLL